MRPYRPKLETYVIFRRRVVPCDVGGWRERLEVADIVRTYRSQVALLDDVMDAVALRHGDHPPMVLPYDAAMERYAWLVMEAEREMKPTRDRVVEASDLSVGVPSQVHRIDPLPAPDEAVVATPLNKITTFPRNSPADGVDEQ